MSTEENVTLRFEPVGEMSIYCAADQKQELMQLLNNCTSAELDLSKVSVIDAAGLQLLLMARNEALRLGKGFSIVAHSDAAIEVIDLCNLSHLFGAQVFIPSAENRAGATP